MVGYFVWSWYQDNLDSQNVVDFNDQVEQVDNTLNKDKILQKLTEKMNLPVDEAEVVTVEENTNIDANDPFLIEAAPSFIIVSYPGLDILFNPETEEVVRSRSYLPNTQ